MTNKQQRTFGCWDSALTAEKVCLDSDDINFVRPAPDGVYFINSVAGEKDKYAAWHLSNNGKLNRISADDYNIRSRLHEYGGVPYIVHENTLYFCNFADQAIYRQLLSDKTEVPVAPKAVPLTPADSELAAKIRYADFLIDTRFNRLICVREDHRQLGSGAFDASKVVNTLVAIDLEQGGEGEILFEGTDFVSSPRLSPDGETLAWQTWSHPNMPWDNTEIRIANFDSKGALTNIRQVQQQITGSLVQPLFDAKGDLYFISDWSDWWNLYRVSAAELNASCTAEAVLPLDAEFAPPQWLLGHRNYALLDDGSIVVSYTRNGQWELGIIKGAGSGPRELITIASGYGQLENLSSLENKVFFSAASPTEANAICSLETDGKSAAKGFAVKRYATDEESALEEVSISRPELICFETVDKQQAYGNFYPPCNPRFTGLANTRPPLLVSIHGGPTSSARMSLNLKIQYWTSRGFAVIDINHRGSSGFGRKFRRSLYRNWGLFDLQDIIFTVRHLADEGRIDRDKVVIRGGSAGGYSVMAALSSCDLFAAGTSYYGVSDLEVLARGTHKFESRYLDQLIGPYPEAQQTYRERSPIYNIENIQAPLLLLQGLEDKVVPPDQAEVICDKLKRRGVDVRYISFEGEGHGFRQLKNQVHALNMELDFYREVLGLK